MQREAIQEIVIRLIRELLCNLGFDKEIEINADTCPIKDFKGFDSLQGVYLTASIEEELRIHANQKLNFFKDDNRKRDLTVREIVDRVCSQVK